MSQEKVDRKKWEKANRKKLNRREKIRRRFSAGIITVLCAAAVFFIGYSAYDIATATSEWVTVDLSAINDYATLVSAD